MAWACALFSHIGLSHSTSASLTIALKYSFSLNSNMCFVNIYAIYIIRVTLIRPFDTLWFAEVDSQTLTFIVPTLGVPLETTDLCSCL